MNLWLLLPLLLPMLAGLLLLTKPFAEGKIRRLTVQIGLILTLVSLLPAFLTSGRDLTLFTLSDNVEIALHVDGIGMCFCVLMAFVWTAAGFYSFDYMAHEGHEKRFYCLYLLTLGVLISASTVFVKQHSMLDVIVAIPVSVVLCLIVYRPFPRNRLKQNA